MSVSVQVRLVATEATFTNSKNANSLVSSLLYDGLDPEKKLESNHSLGNHYFSQTLGLLQKLQQDLQKVQKTDLTNNLEILKKLSKISDLKFYIGASDNQKAIYQF